MAATIPQKMTIGPREIEKIVDEMGASILGYLKTMLDDEHLAEDVMQNIFVRLFRSGRSGYEVENLKAFVFTVVRNELMRELGHKRNRKCVRLEDVPEIFDLREKNALSREEKIVLEEALRSLPSEQREVVYLKIYGELTFEEIGGCLGIPLKTAASRYRYGIEKMAQFLGDTA